MTRFLSVLCFLAGTGLLAGAYFEAGDLLLGFASIVLMGVWLSNLRLRQSWLSVLWFCFYDGLAALGFFLIVPAGSDPNLPGLVTAQLIGGAGFAFLATDLTDFDARLRFAAPEDDVPSLERRHMLRLLSVTLVGGAFSVLALGTHVVIPFGWVLIVTILAIGGITLTIRRLIH